MARLYGQQRNAMLQKTRQRKSEQRGVRGRSVCACTFLCCLACICVLLNVFVITLTLMVHRRVQQEELLEREQILGTQAAGSQAAASNGGATSSQQQQQQQQKQQQEQSTSSSPNSQAVVAQQNNNNSNTNSNSNVPPTKFHIVFQTDCKDPTQDWQAFVLFHSIMTSGQQGHATRVVTGCGSPSVRRKALERQHQTQIAPMGSTGGHRVEGKDNSRFHLYFAPSHPQQEQVGHLRKHMKYFNRPYGIQHWMENTMGYANTNWSTSHDDTIIIVMDTDMFILRTFQEQFHNHNELWQDQIPQQQDNNNNNNNTNKVAQGHPLAQHAAFPSSWWQEVPTNRLTPVISEGILQLQSMPRQDIENHYAAAPPFLITARDFYPLVKQWAEFTYPLYEVYDEKIMREPHGPYMLAAVVMHQPHQLASSFRVHTSHDAGMALFQTVLSPPRDGTGLHLPDPPGCRDFPQDMKPHVVQYSKRYALGDYTIGKHYVAMELIGKLPESCQKPLFQDPPDTVAQLFNHYHDPELKTRVDVHNQYQVHLMAFMLCEIIQAINEAAIYFKQQHCQGMTVNMEKTVSFQS